MSLAIPLRSYVPFFIGFFGLIATGIWTRVHSKRRGKVIVTADMIELDGYMRKEILERQYLRGGPRIHEFGDKNTTFYEIVFDYGEQVVPIQGSFVKPANAQGTLRRIQTALNRDIKPDQAGASPSPIVPKPQGVPPSEGTPPRPATSRSRPPPRPGRL